MFNNRNGEELTQKFLKSDISLLICVFENFIKVSVDEFGINPLYCVGLPSCTCQCGLKNTGINLQTLQQKDLILKLGNNIRCGISSIMGDRYVKLDKNKNLLYMDATHFFGHSMIQSLPYDKINMWHVDPNLYMINFKETLDRSDDSDTGYFIEVDLRYPDNRKEKTKISHLLLKIKLILKIIIMII